MRCGRVRLTLFFPLHNSNFLYQIENVVCYPFRTANLVDNGTKEGQIGEGCTLLLMSHPNRGFLAPKWVTHHFWEIYICGAAPLSINAILPICEGLVAARMTLCAVVNTSHPHIPETHQESRMKAFVG